MRVYQVLKRKPEQVHFKFIPAGAAKAGAELKTACLMLAVLGAGIFAPLSAQATSVTPSAAATAFAFGGSYPRCERLCPTGFPFPAGVACCPTPDLLLRQAFRGPLPGSLDDWYIKTFWPMIGKGIAYVTNQITTQIQNETARRGTLLNGQENIRAITSLQKASAATAKDFAISESMCRFATLSQSLGSSDNNAEAIRIAMSKKGIDRQLLVENTAGAQNTSGQDGKPVASRGQAADKDARWAQYLKTFCDPDDYGQGVAPNGVCGTTSEDQQNSDINYVKTVGEKLTLDIGDSVATKDSVNLDALYKNLYAHDLVNNIPPALFKEGTETDAEASRKYQRFISGLAKRAVAQNSFSSIAAMKAKGTAGSGEYMQKLMMELGLTKEQAEQFITDNPSYYAQMEALTRKMYQSPSFYVNLMEGPVNVKRQQTAMKSFELMQQRDMYKSFQRSEMLMATLLELQLANSQTSANQTAGQGQ